MKNFESGKLVRLTTANENGTTNEEYRYGTNIISVSRFRSLVSDDDCVVISFDRIRRNRNWEKEVAAHFGDDLHLHALDKAERTQAMADGVVPSDVLYAAPLTDSYLRQWHICFLPILFQA